MNLSKLHPSKLLLAARVAFLLSVMVAVPAFALVPKVLEKLQVSGNFGGVGEHASPAELSDSGTSFVAASPRAGSDKGSGDGGVNRDSTQPFTAVPGPGKPLPPPTFVAKTATAPPSPPQPLRPPAWDPDLRHDHRSGEPSQRVDRAQAGARFVSANAHPSAANHGSRQTSRPESAPSQSPVDSHAAAMSALQQRLRELGAMYYRLETWDPPEGARRQYKFRCEMPLQEHPGQDGAAPMRRKIFQATAESGLAAMQRVAAQVEAWASSRR